MEKNLNDLYRVLLYSIEKYLHFEKYDNNISDDAFIYVLNESKRHNLVQLISDACSSLNDEQKKIMFSASVQVLMHFENQDYFRNQVYAAFEAAGIDYIPLKGSVLKDYYNEPWHRTCGDIDILVRPHEIERAINILVNSGVCELKDKSEHDVVFVHSNGSILELHYDLHEKECSVDDVWKTALQSKDSHLYYMTNEMFAFCHIAHMAKHFRRSGCGLRPFVDLYILKNRMGFDEIKLETMLRVASLEKFYRSMLSLIDCWFNDKELSSEQRLVSEYVLTGGVFGSVESKVAIKRSKMSGIKYFFRRAFVSCKGLAYKYPILKKYPYLYFFCNAHRWYCLLFKGKFNIVKEELSTNASLSNDVSEKILKIHSYIGL